MSLEQIAQTADTVTEPQGSVDVYLNKQEPLYSGGQFDKKLEPVEPIGSNGSGFKAGSPGNIRRTVAPGLQERYDASGHNNSSLHLNQDLKGADGAYSANALGPAHKIDI